MPLSEKELKAIPNRPLCYCHETGRDIYAGELVSDLRQARELLAFWRHAYRSQSSKTIALDDLEHDTDAFLRGEDQ